MLADEFEGVIVRTRLGVDDAEVDQIMITTRTPLKSVMTSRLAAPSGVVGRDRAVHTGRVVEPMP